VGADRQRHHADHSGGNGDRAAGDAKLRYIHRGSFLVVAKGAQVSRADAILGLRGCRTVCRPIMLNLRHRNNQTLNLPLYVRQPY
jgi:hypothetical protein